MTAAGVTIPALTSCDRKPELEPGPTASSPTPGPNDQIGVGIIGCGRRNAQLQIGRGDQGIPPRQARIVAVSDLNITRAKQWGEKHQVEAYQDYRKMLDRKDIDVVIYATPEHWHYLPCIHACQAGKDVYGEQPLSHSIREGRMMVERSSPARKGLSNRGTATISSGHAESSRADHQRTNRKDQRDHWVQLSQSV